MSKLKIAVALLVAAGVVGAQPARSVWDGVYTAEQAKRGQALYSKHCASCHSDNLMGGESAPPLAGEEFLANWNGLTASELFERIRSTMPQDKPRTLTREVNTDIVAYLFSANKFPAGKTELPQDTQLLKLIHIEPNSK